MSHAPTISTPPSASSMTALLALKRFVRGPLKQLSMGVASVIMILNLSIHTPAVNSETTPETTASRAAVSHRATPVHLAVESSERHSITSRATTQQDTRQGHLNQARMPAHLLSAHMTHHRLTGARLSVPASHRRAAIASLSATQ